MIPIKGDNKHKVIKQMLNNNNELFVMLSNRVTRNKDIAVATTESIFNIAFPNINFSNVDEKQKEMLSNNPSGDKRRADYGKKK